MQEHSSAEPPLTKIRVPGEGPAWWECSNEVVALGLALHRIERVLKKDAVKKNGNYLNTDPSHATAKKRLRKPCSMYFPLKILFQRCATELLWLVLSCPHPPDAPLTSLHALIALHSRGTGAQGGAVLSRVTPSLQCSNGKRGRKRNYT